MACYKIQMKHKLTGQGGKGSARRNSNEKAYAEGWDKIFGSKKKKPVLPVLKEDDTQEIDKS